MAVPRNRTSNRRKNNRRSHHAKKPRQPATCPNCQSMKQPHTVCSACGYYGDRVVMAVAE